MIKNVHNNVWAFDAEWAPDPLAGRMLYHLPETSGDAEVVGEMWQRNGATPENPSPFLKTVMCRILSIAVVTRTVQRDGRVVVNLLSLPKALDDPEQCAEGNVVGTFLKAVGERKPQLVGYNSIAADIRALVQRGMILGLQSADFCRRPNKPWEGPDYFARGSDWNLDLRDAVTPGFGSGTPSLNEIAVLSGIPGKMEVDGNQVPHLWLAGKLKEIVDYNEFDAVTTYLLWLRAAHFSGLFTPEQYYTEQERVRALLEYESSHNGKLHLLTYLEEWRKLRAMIGDPPLAAANP